MGKDKRRGHQLLRPRSLTMSTSSKRDLELWNWGWECYKRRQTHTRMKSSSCGKKYKISYLITNKKWPVKSRRWCSWLPKCEETLSFATSSTTKRSNNSKRSKTSWRRGRWAFADCCQVWVNAAIWLWHWFLMHSTSTLASSRTTSPSSTKIWRDSIPAMRE